MIIPEKDFLILKIYECGHCHKIFKKTYDKSGIEVSCLVYHSPNSCRHFREIEIDKIN